MSGVVFPQGLQLARLERTHPRSKFDCGEPRVTEWLKARALQHQDKRLSVTKVLVAATGEIAGFYTLATGQVDFSDLPPELLRTLPRRALPVALLAWLGVDVHHQELGLGKRLLAQALRDCHDAGQTFAFVAVIVDCINESAKSFYTQWDFVELPGHPFRLFLSAGTLDVMVRDT